MREVSQHDKLITDLRAEFTHFLMRPPEKIVEDAQLIHQLERGGMDRVAAKIPQEIRMLFQYYDRDTSASQQEPEHHPRRTTAHDAALRLDCWH